MTLFKSILINCFEQFQLNGNLPVNLDEFMNELSQLMQDELLQVLETFPLLSSPSQKNWEEDILSSIDYSLQCRFTIIFFSILLSKIPIHSILFLTIVLLLFDIYLIIICYDFHTPLAHLVRLVSHLWFYRAVLYRNLCWDFNDLLLAPQRQRAIISR